MNEEIHDNGVMKDYISIHEGLHENGWTRMSERYTRMDEMIHGNEWNNTR